MMDLLEGLEITGNNPDMEIDERTPFEIWFDTFIEEKNLPVASWELEGPDGMTHWIDSDVVIEYIRIAPPKEQFQIKDVIVKIDFMNGDINHFFNHLAKAIVAQY